MSNPNLPENKLQQAKLTLQTRFRFMEIELNQAVSCLAPMLGSRVEAGQFIYNQLKTEMYPGNEEELDDFLQLVLTRTFQRPTKQELIFYFRSLGASYHQIRKITGISPNTTSQYKDVIPDLVPIYRHWALPHVGKWNEIKGNLNLWKEDLVHAI